MSTLANMAEEVLLNLEGLGALQDSIAESTGTPPIVISSTATTLFLKGTQLSAGAGVIPSIIEVGDELMYVKGVTYPSPATTYDAEVSVLRGYRGTTAVEHTLTATNNLVRINPRFPNVAVKRAINDTIQGLYPRLPAIKTAEINYLANQFRYDLPADARNVLAVSVRSLGNPVQWHPARYWTFDATGGSGSATGKSIDLRDGNPGRPFRVVYTAEPTALATNSTTLASVGLPDWAREIVIYGACWRLASFVDAVSAMGASAEQTLLNDGQVGAAGRQNVARYFLGMFETRLAEGEARMQDAYPAPRHYIR